MPNHLEAAFQEILSPADVRVNGSRPWDIVVHNPDFYSRVFRQGSIGLGESYMDGWWDCAQPDEFFTRILEAGIDRRARRNWRVIWLFLKSLIFNRQTKSRAGKVGKEHYDLGNELFESMLDHRMVYTSGHWKNAATLEEAQEAKLDFVCRKLALGPGMKVLDIGCGWGSFAKFAAEKYGARVTGITISREQLELARKLCAGLPVELRLEDYRELHDSFDCVVSLGMFEHVGCKNYGKFFDVARHAVRNAGRLYLSTIGSTRSVRTTDPWIERYIFPNSHLPSLRQIGDAIRGRFIVEELENWAPDYDRTLIAWFHNFEAHWEKLRTKYNERFYRMWKFYLLASAGSFRSRRLQVWQILMSPVGFAGKSAPPAPADYARMSATRMNISGI
ncbi:MAG: cyclopropane fatty acyl phospholipid synthase [Candidatus Acidiferrales bacterium]